MAGIDVNWVRTGPSDAPTIVFVHAVGLDLTYWDRQIGALRSNFRVVAFDLPGHGRSAGSRADWTFATAVATIARLIETVSEGPVHLAGISFGGMLAQATVLAHPELVRSLRPIGTAPAFSQPVRDGMRARAGVARRLRHGCAAAIDVGAVVYAGNDGAPPRSFTPPFGI